MARLALRALALFVAAVVGLSPAAVAYAHGAAHHRGSDEHGHADATRIVDADADHDHDAIPAESATARITTGGGDDHAHVLAAEASRPRNDAGTTLDPLAPAHAAAKPVQRESAPPVRVDAYPRAGPAWSAPTQPRAPPSA